MYDTNGSGRVTRLAGSRAEGESGIDEGTYWKLGRGGVEEDAAREEEEREITVDVFC